ncbi:hypothetical protein LIER_41220 [Lithospermum erythrorhizon]|uniref:Uncharacterized protein n=1 Tax=Lithospermum erythrorhizon TaxID=34254 RepID=A0AAV3RA63_LITER
MSFIAAFFLFSMLIDSGATGAPPIMPQSGTMPPVSEMPLSPTSVSSSGRFPFSASEISGMGADASALDAAFTSDMVLPPENGAATTRSFDQISWNFSLSDLTADLSNLGDLGPLGNYPGSPFLPSDSDILLDSPDQEDIVEEFFVDSVPGPPCTESDEEKPSTRG